MTTDAVGSLSFCSCATAVVTATDLVVSAAVVPSVPVFFVVLLICLFVWLFSA